MPYKTKKPVAIDTSSLEALGQSVIALAQHVDDEFGQVASSFQATEADPIIYNPPPKPRPGTYAYADGTHWNPGGGEGPYYYNSAGVWKSMTPAGVSTFNGRSGAVTLVASDVSGVGGMLTTGGQTITGGFKITPSNAIGSVSSGTVTPDPFNGNYQYYSNAGAHTLAPPTSDCAMDILITNVAGAGAITAGAGQGWTIGVSVGDPFTTTNGHRFFVSIRRVNSVATYTVKALQ